MSWFTTLFRRKTIEEQLDRELRFHLESRIDDLIQAGRSREAARREALVEFGGVEAAKEGCRDERSGHWLETLWQDVRYAFRQCAKTPGFTFTIIVTLALAIGACTAVFSVVDAILLRPYFRNEDPERQIRIREIHPPQAADVGLAPATFLDFLTLNSFQSVSAVRGGNLSLTGQGEPERLSVAQITAGGFDVYRFQVVLGRALLPDDFEPGQEHVIFLRNETWQAIFGGDPNIVGKQVQLNGEPWTVIGVGTPDWGRAGNSYQGLVPLVFTAAERTSRTARNWNVTGRLKPGITFEQAKAEVDLLGLRLAAQYPDAYRGWEFTLVDNFEWNARTLRRTLWTLFGAVGCVLLIACANVANLLLARANVRQREMSVRAALGASRGRLLRQLLTESLLLACLGGGAGVLVARWAVDAITYYAAAPGMGRFAYLELNSGMLGFALALSVATGIIFGLAPAWLASAADVNESLKIGSRGSTEPRHRGRLRDGLVVLEIAATLMLVTAAGLLMRNFVRTISNPGYSAEGVMVMQVNLTGTTYSKLPARMAFVTAVLERLRTLPGVEAAAATTELPATIKTPVEFAIEGRVPAARADWPTVDGFTVTPDYFRSLAIQLRRGRLFDAHDDATAPRVALVSESFARQYFPEEEPLGRRLNFARAGTPDSWREIVGIVSDVSAGQPADASWLQVYHPIAQNPPTNFSFLVRVAGNPAGILSSLKPQVFAVDKDQPVTAIRSLESLMEQRVLAQRFTLHLLAVFSIVALVIATVGLYGVIAYHVSQRVMEIGIRMALGASASIVLALVLRRAARLVGAGLLVGLGGALAGGSLIQSMLFNVSARDPFVLVTGILLLGGIAMLACLLPARRAAKVDPMIAMRAE